MPAPGESRGHVMPQRPGDPSLEPKPARCRRREPSDMFRDLSTSLIIRGVVAIALGVVSIVWPNITVGAFVIVFAIYAFWDAFMQGGLAFSSATAGPVFG